MHGTRALHGFSACSFHHVTVNIDIDTLIFITENMLHIKNIMYNVHIPFPKNNVIKT